MLALVITDHSVGEGVYTPRQALALARQLGYAHLATWDHGIHAYPRCREELEWPRKARALQGLPPEPENLHLHLGCRFTWGGHAYGALPHSNRGYAQLCRFLTRRAHGEDPGEPPSGSDCVLLAETLEGLEALLKEGFPAALLALPGQAQEARRALEGGRNVLAPQLLRFRTPLGLRLHHLKRAMAQRSTLGRTEPLWTERDAALPLRDWEARFPAAEPRVRRATEEALEKIASWRIHWGRWVSTAPLGREGEDLDALLAARAREGVRLRYGRLDGALERRLETELDLIRRKGFAGYFLLVQDLVQAAGLKRICGRGSGAASLVGYALELSNVDPVGTNLLFERFLTPEREDPPDMDIDFPWDEREEVILAAFRRYGRERVAMVSNHVFMQPRSALRAVAMAFGRPESELRQLARLVRGWEGGLPRAAEHRAWAELLPWAQALEGHFHQLSVHPGGTVVVPGPLWEHVPSQPAPAKEGVSITQWDKDGVEGYGLVKIDLLGNRSLAVIRDSYAVLGDKVARDPGTHSRQDPATQRLLAQGDSMGVFYVESPATRQLQQRVGKGDFESLVIHSSLIRPAAHRWIDRYVKRARGEEAFEPSAPVFAELLSESFGVLVYQEDVLKVCVALAGWTHHEADQLRKLLGKHDCEARLPIFEARFRAGCRDKGVAEAVVEEAWDMIRSFRGYSFCKPHSASYAQVSFESAWVKAHHPAVFFASVISNQGGFYPAIAYLGDARRHNLVVRGPDVNHSGWAFQAEGEQGLRVGLLQVKGAREAEVKGLLEERERGGAYGSLEELLERLRPSLPTVEALCSAGAFDRWAPDGDRTRLLWTRLGGPPPGLRPRPTNPFDRAEQELETLGLTLELHPAALLRFRHGGGPQRAADVAKPGRRLRFWALVVADKPVRTEKGEPMQFVTLEDETGLAEAVAFPDAYRRRRRPYRVGDIVPVAGKSTKQDGLSVLELEG